MEGLVMVSRLELYHFQLYCGYCDEAAEHYLYWIFKWYRLFVCTQCNLQEEVRVSGAPSPMLDPLQSLVDQAIDAIR